ncbi:MFS transporter [Haladaptatus pallidirubidus]|uniref:Tetracycline resistance MFS efflux pump n=1 Tax=Haladaptatus pallidirubidus TaxID=1008152 RepID=A0AAV3UKD8_9EURY|nr:MFS transporter [Haladaptatus pallidirubidus]
MAEGTGSNHALATVFAIVFVDLLGFGILIPIIPLYATQFGANELVVGLLLASYSITQFVFAPILGRLSDESGRRPILLLSLFGSVLAWTLFGLAESLAVLFLARLFAGAMGGNIATAQAYIADVTPPEDRAKGLGLIGAAFGLGFVFGPALGGLASSDAAIAFVRGLSPEMVPINRFSLPSFLAAGICALNLAVAFFVLPETRTKRSAEREPSGMLETPRLARLFDSLSDPALSGLVVSFFLLSLAFSGMESMFVLFTEQKYGYGTTMNGYVLAYVGVVIAIVQGGLIGRLTDRFGERTIALIGVSLELVTLAAIPFSPEIGRLFPTIGPLSGGLLALLFVLTPLAVGNGFANVSLNTLVSKSASADEQGGAFGLTQSGGSIARAVGPVAAGGLYAAVAYWVPFVLGGLLMVPICYILLTAVQVGRRTTPAD